MRAIQLDLTRLLLWGGAALLFFTLRSPYAAAEALAVGESFALNVVRALAASDEAAAALAATTETDKTQAHAKLLASLQATSEPAHGEFALVRPAVGAGVLLESRDWMFFLALTPAVLGEDSPPGAYEAWAWPRRPDSRYTTAFCVRQGKTWATRNLTRRYLGAAAAPAAGGWRPRQRGDDAEYWSVDSQYWRLHP